MGFISAAPFSFEHEMDLKAYQEFHLLADGLADHANAWHESKLREQKDRIAFFGETTASAPFSFGQCGDHVYWKVVDRVLYIRGIGPMWDFDNTSVDFPKDAVSAPWLKEDYNIVMIENGVTTIGTDAFHGAEISDIILPSSIRTVKELAFFDAKIAHLILPETIETLEESILNGFRRVADTLVLSVNIANIQPYALFNRNDCLAKTVVLTGSLPKELTSLVESCLFDDVEHYDICYPADWDTTDGSFYEKLTKSISDPDENFQRALKDALKPYKIP